jgi:hypothetical protein
MAYYRRDILEGVKTLEKMSTIPNDLGEMENNPPLRLVK